MADALKPAAVPAVDSPYTRGTAAKLVSRVANVLLSSRINVNTVHILVDFVINKSRVKNCLLFKENLLLMPCVSLRIGGH